MDRLSRHYARLFERLPILEGLLLSGAVYLAVLLHVGTDPVGIRVSVGSIRPEAIVLAAVVLPTMTALGLYNRRLRDGLEGIVARLLLSILVAMMVLAPLYCAFAGGFLGHGILFVALVIGYFAILLVRSQSPALSRREGGKRRVLVLGSGRGDRVIARLRRTTKAIGIRVFGYGEFSDESPFVSAESPVVPDRPLARRVRELRIDALVAALDERRRNRGMPRFPLWRSRDVVIRTNSVTSIRRWIGSGARRPYTGDRLGRSAASA